MKKPIIILASVIILIIGIIAGVRYLQSFHAVTINKDSDVTSVDIYTSPGRQIIQTVTENQTTISLQDGDYTYEAKGERIGTITLPFSVSENTTLTISPSYSEEYLSTLLEPQEQTIIELVRSRYPEIINDYTIQPGKLFEKGEWYATILTKTEDDLYGVSETYRVLLHKEGDSWSIVRYPEIVLLSVDYPDVPIDILHKVNNITRQY